jgi:porphyrinogen peroxidase
MGTTQPQGILSPLTEAAIFLVATVGPGGEERARGFLAEVSGLRRSVGFRGPGDELSCVVGIGSDLWARMFGEPRPAGLRPFAEIQGGQHTAVSTAGDLLFHLRARRLDLCFELATLFANAMAGWGRIVDEVHGFRSFDQRDLLGFVDGTENPEGTEAADAVLIGEEDAEFAGGTYVIVQKYLHDMPAWDALSVEDQEAAIGRTKLDDVELPDDLKPSNSHVALNVIEDEDGNELAIWRLNMPFGKVADDEYGTYFIGYARTPDVTERMLRNMFIGVPPGNHDRILDFSRAVTGGLFFVPTEDFLDDPPGQPSVTAEATPTRTTTDGSLRIGGMRA